MLFNSIDFAWFLPLIFACYWAIPKKAIQLQNAFILLASFIFYGWWDWRFLVLISISIITDFLIGNAISQSQQHIKRKSLLILSILINLGILGFFKYANFFIENFIRAFSFFGTELSNHHLDIILPVGISFYTFQTLSYTIDVYRNKMTATKNIISFAAFVSFFPQLVAGPIERASHLLPQFYKQRSFNYQNTINGFRQILWGFFKKLVIADNCAVLVDIIFDSQLDHSGSTLLLGAILFAFQIYGDFSGYSDIAIGTAKIFGFNLKQNFAFPYFSRSIDEFWRKWHISLTSWFKDYLYIPLGGNRRNLKITLRNIMLVFLISGFWHGAKWTFIFWGLFHALLFIPIVLSGNNRKNMKIIAYNQSFPTIKEIGQMLLTFLLVSIAWILFRADSISHAVSYISTICSFSLFEPLTLIGYSRLFIILGTVILMLCLEWKFRAQEFVLENFEISTSKWQRHAIYYLILILIFLFSTEQQQFIYFQF